MSYTLRISRPREVARQKKRPSINVLSIRNRTTYLDESAVVAFSGPPAYFNWDWFWDVLFYEDRRNEKKIR